MEVGYSLIDSKFDIIELIGTGSTSSVYKVKNKNLLNSHFALKILHPSLMRNETVAKRFQRELLASHTVNHPNIVRGYDFIRQGSILAYTMEYADNGSLRSYIDKNRKLNYSEVVKLAVQLAAGLSAIHQEGVIHRNLKPENILLTKNGYYKISDFGIAKLLNSKTLTKQGEILGQIDYSSPECINSSEYDERSDIYSYGLIIYEAIVGQKAFGITKSYKDLIQRASSEVPMPIESDPSCPQVLNNLVRKCCHLDPSNRFQYADEIVGYLYENEKSSKKHVLEVSSAHHSIISFNDNNRDWNSSLWKGIDGNKKKSNLPFILLGIFLCSFLSYFFFISFL